MNTFFWIVIGVITGLIILMLLVVAHEFGHFIMARRNGINVKEFGIGFPPRAIAWVKKDLSDNSTGDSTSDSTNSSVTDSPNSSSNNSAGKTKTRSNEIKTETKSEKTKSKKAQQSSTSEKSKTKAEKVARTVLLSDDSAKSSDHPKTDQTKSARWQKIPKAEWDKPQDSLVFSLNWLPIGGFCAMDGESDSDTRPGTFGATSFWSKTKVLFGGVIMNWIVAFLILTVLSFTGMPQFIDHQFYLGQDAQIVGDGVRVEEVMADSPAQKAGFEPGDQILKIDQQEVLYPSDISNYDAEHANEEVHFLVKREGTEHDLTAKLNAADSEYILGITMSYGQTFVRSTWSAPIVGLGTTIQLTGETFRGFGQIIANLCTGVISQFSPNDSVREAGRSSLNTVGDSVSGPIGIIGIIFPSFVRAGATNLAFLAALISVSLACMNVLPIPALDGGRWLMIAIYRMRGKVLKRETEEKIVSRAFAVLLILIAIISILDISKLF